MSDALVTRLRALADMHYPAKLTVVLREAADALEAEETRRMMLNTSNGEWSKRFHAAEAEAAALRSALQGILEGADHPASGTKAYVKLVLTQPGPGAALLERLESEKTRADLAEERADKLVDKNDALADQLARWKDTAAALADVVSSKDDRLRELEAVAEAAKVYEQGVSRSGDVYAKRQALFLTVAALEEKP